MKPILIIKTGNIKQELRALHGDKEDMFLRRCGVDKDKTRVVTVYEGEQLPEPDEICGCTDYRICGHGDRSRTLECFHRGMGTECSGTGDSYFGCLLWSSTHSTGIWR